MKIDLTIESDLSCGFTASKLESATNNVLNKLNLEKAQTTVEVFLVSSEKIRNLNKEHRGKNEATDVLSFPQEHFPIENEQTLGTIFISPEFARSEEVNCLELFVHGILHLLGFDHETNIKSWHEAKKKLGELDYELQ